MSRHIKFSSVGNDLTDRLEDCKCYKTKRKITSISVHCSFSPQGRGDDAHTIDAWHKQRWGSGIGYHYVVLEDGTLQKGRWVDYAPAAVKGYNAHNIAICRIGGMDEHGHATHDATSEQIETIIELTQCLIDTYGLEPGDVLGHTEYKGVLKSCPLMDMGNVRSRLS